MFFFCCFQCPVKSVFNAQNNVRVFFLTADWLQSGEASRGIYRALHTLDQHNHSGSAHHTGKHSQRGNSMRAWVHMNRRVCVHARGHVAGSHRVRQKQDVYLPAAVSMKCEMFAQRVQRHSWPLCPWLSHQRKQVTLPAVCWGQAIVETIGRGKDHFSERTVQPTYPFL